MDTRIIITFITLLFLVYSCNSNKNNECDKLNVKLEETIYVDNYLMSLDNSSSYRDMNNAYISDSARNLSQYKLGAKLNEINKNVVTIISTLRKDFILGLKGNEGCFPDTIMLSQLSNKNEEKYTTKFYTSLFKNKLTSIEKLHKELSELSVSNEFSKPNSLNDIWNQENLTAQEFITRLTLTQNIFVSHIFYIYKKRDRRAS